MIFGRDLHTAQAAKDLVYRVVFNAMEANLLCCRYWTRRVSTDNSVRRNVFDHDASGCAHAPFVERYSRRDKGTCSYPATVANNNRLGDKIKLGRTKIVRTGAKESTLRKATIGTDDDFRQG